MRTPDEAAFRVRPDLGQVLPNRMLARRVYGRGASSTQYAVTDDT